MSAWKRELIVVALLVFGAPFGWMASFYLWRSHVVDGGDDPRMLLVVLSCMIVPALLGAWPDRELFPRLVAYPSMFAAVVWALRPAVDGFPRYPREFRFLHHYQFHDFYPSLIIPAAFLGGIIAIVFTTLLDNQSDSGRR
jgi:hypothetical protein